MTETTITLPYVFQVEVLTRLKIIFTLLGVAQTPVPPNFEAETLAGLDQLVHFLQASQTKNKPTRLALALPIITKKDGTIMNFQLKNDTIADILITTINDAGAIVAAPAGDVDSVISSDATKLAATIGTMPATSAFAGSPSLHLVPVMKGPFVGVLTATLTDSAGLRQDIVGVDIVEDLTATALSVDLTNVVLTPQPVPAT
jgi:hypothetical protein